MSIGLTIKRLRFELGITQEQLGEYMGVSSQAVSQWECDKTAPDISQLPLLAQIFDVTSDEILGIDIQKNEKRIKEIIDEANQFHSGGDFKKCADILENGLRKYPRSFRLMAELADTLGLLPGRIPEAIELCQRVLSECTNKEICDDALNALIYAYIHSGDRKSALQYAHKLSHIWRSQEEMLINMLDGSIESERAEARENLQLYINFCAERLMLCLEKLSNKAYGYSDEDRLKLLEQQTAIGETIYCDGDSNFDAQFIAIGYQHMAEIYIERLDIENTLCCLEKESKLRVHFDTYDETVAKTSPAVRGMCDGGWITSDNGNQSLQMLKRLEDNAYDLIRNDERFTAIINALREYAR